MYCSRCGQELPAKAIKCPVCNSPTKKWRRYKQRLFLGLIIFLAGAFTGSIFDSLVFRGHSWNHSILNKLFPARESVSATATTTISSPPAWEVIPASNAIDLPEKKPITSGKTAIVPPDVINFKPGQADAPSMAQLPHIDRSTSSLDIAPPVIPRTDFQMQVELSASLSQPSSIPIEAAATNEQKFETIATLGEASAVGPKRSPIEVSTDFDLQPASLEELEDGESNNYHGSLWIDGDTLLFVSTRDSPKSKPIYQPYLRSLKSKRSAMRLFSWPGNVWTPEFSKDGKLLLFSSDSIEKEHIFVYNRITQQHRRLTEGNTKNMMPAISPDGKSVVFTSNRKGNNDIWLTSIDGGEPIQLTSGPEDDREPRWWPDGKSIVFTRIIQKLKVSHIMKLAIDPLGKPEALVSDNGRNWLPDPSPDGGWLAYVRSESDDGSKNVIHVRRLDDKHEFVISAFGSADAFKPVWIHDFSGIICHADRGGRKIIYMVKLNKKPKM